MDHSEEEMILDDDEVKDDDVIDEEKFDCAGGRIRERVPVERI